MNERTGPSDRESEQEVASPDPTSADAPADASAPSGAYGEETVEALRNAVTAARSSAEEHLQGWQRSQADFANYRRRIEQERSDLIKLAEADLVRDILPVLDDLERALAGLPKELYGMTWVDGILLIERKLRAVLEAHGVT